MTFARDVAKFSKSLQEVLKEAKRTGTLSLLGNAAIHIIQKRTWSGKGVKQPGGSTFALKPLSANYIKYRKVNRFRLSSQTSPGKSNLTFTGQLLYSLGLKKNSKSITIEPQGKRKDGKSNAEVAGYVSKTRPFLALSRDEQVTLGKFFRKTFDELVSRKVK